LHEGNTLVLVQRLSSTMLWWRTNGLALFEMLFAAKAYNTALCSDRSAHCHVHIFSFQLRFSANILHIHLAAAFVESASHFDL